MNKPLLYLLCIISLYACSKRDTSPPSLKSYTKKMAGRRHWNGNTKFYYTRQPLPDTIVYGAVGDSGITIEVINDSTIHIPWGDYSLGYHKTTDSQDYIVFRGNSSYPGYPNSIELHYFYIKDSMTDTTYQVQPYTSYSTFLKTP